MKWYKDDREIYRYIPNGKFSFISNAATLTKVLDFKFIQKKSKKENDSLSKYLSEKVKTKSDFWSDISLSKKGSPLSLIGADITGGGTLRLIKVRKGVCLFKSGNN